MFQTRIEPGLSDPEDLHGLRARINAETLGEYARFRQGLKPDFAMAKRHIAAGYLALLLIITMVGVGGLVAVPLGAALIGYVIAYLQLFIHEAAHYGLAADRPANDRLADRMICWQVGTSIASYRASHWEHHRSLGDSGDTEISYRNRLSLAFLAKMVTGIHALSVFTARSELPKSGKSSGRFRPLLIGVAAHLLILSVLTLAGGWHCALAWMAGMGVFFPLFATLRQLLEHRPMAGETDKAAVTRIFGDDAFSRTFGGAGFNRHLLHHLEPQLSYTRLGDLEAYLMNTSAKEQLAARRTSYWRAFVGLLQSDRNG